MKLKSDGNTIFQRRIVLGQRSPLESDFGLDRVCTNRVSKSSDRNRGILSHLQRRRPSVPWIHRRDRTGDGTGVWRHEQWDVKRNVCVRDTAHTRCFRFVSEVKCNGKSNGEEFEKHFDFSEERNRRCRLWIVEFVGQSRTFSQLQHAHESSEALSSLRQEQPQQ